jgi:hypothetical protein
MHRPWHDRLDAEMKRRGVPAKFRRRVLAEASDHADDLTEGGATMTDVETRLGDPGDVAATAADQHRRTTWTRRHPLPVFGLLPVPLFLLALVLTTLLVWLAVAAVGLAAGGGDLEKCPREVTVWAAYTLVWGLKFVPFALLVWFFTRRFVRSGVHWGWYAAAMAQVLFFAVTWVSTVHYNDTPGESTVVWSFLWLPNPTTDGWEWLSWRMVNWSHLFQLLVPAGLAWGLVTLAKRRQVALAV